MNSKSRSRRWAILPMSPVSRLSMPTIEWPRSRSVSLRWDPMKPAAPVMTVLGISLKETSHEREPHDLEIEGHGPVFDVVQVVLDALLERRVAAPPVDLCPSRDARLHLVTEHVLGNTVFELLDEERSFGPRPDDRHVAAQDVPEL